MSTEDEVAQLRAQLALAGCFRTDRPDGWDEGTEVHPSPHEERIAELTESLSGARAQLRAPTDRIRADHVPEGIAVADHGGADTFTYCKGCGVDLDEEPCPYLEIVGRQP